MDDYDEARKAYVEVYTGLKRQQQALKDKESGLLVDVRKKNNSTFIKQLLLSKIPAGGKYRRARNLVIEVCNRNLVSKNFYIARRIWKVWKKDKGEVKLSVNDYKTGAADYSGKVKNLHKTVRKFMPAGYSISFNKESDTTTIIRLK